MTILYPFVTPPVITAATMTALAGAVASVQAFDCEFPATGWFGQDVFVARSAARRAVPCSDPRGIGGLFRLPSL